MSDSVFKSFPKLLSLEEKIECIVHRHRNDYFVGWTGEQLQMLKKLVRPVPSVALDEAVISQNEKLLNKKRAWVWLSEADSAKKSLRED